MNVIDRDQIDGVIPNRSDRDRTIVFTNGCFDLLHKGHVHLLREAKSLGDYLIVGLNSDDSIRRIKGPERPILSEDDRGALIDSLEMVDDVVFFDEDTPLELLHSLEPDVLVKGADYQRDEIVGSDFVTSYGGRVKRVELLEGKGTTQIVDQIRHDDD